MRGRRGLLVGFLLFCGSFAPTAQAENGLRPATEAESRFIRELVERGVVAIATDRLADLFPIANRESRAMVASERQVALTADASLLLSGQGDASVPCVPYGFRIAALRFRQYFPGEELAALSEERFFALTAMMSLQLLSPRQAQTGLEDSYSELSAGYRRPEVLRQAIRDFVVANEGGGWTLLGSPDIVVDLAGRAFVRKANSWSLGLWPGLDLRAWPIASLESDGVWRLDLRWLFGPAPEAALRLATALRWGRQILQGTAPDLPRSLSAFSDRQLFTLVQGYVSHDGLWPRLADVIEAPQPLPNDAVACPRDAWPFVPTTSAFASLREAIHGMRYSDPLEGPHGADESAVMALLVRSVRELLRGNNWTLSHLLDQRSLQAFAAMRETALHAPREILSSEAMEECYGAYGVTQVLRLRAQQNARWLERMPAREVAQWYLDFAVGANALDCNLFFVDGEGYGRLCQVPNADTADDWIAYLRKRQDLLAALLDPTAARRAFAEGGFGGLFLFGDNAYFSGRLPALGGGESAPIATRSPTGSWRLNMESVARALDQAVTLAGYGGATAADRYLAGLRFWAGVDAESPLLEPLESAPFSLDENCFHKIMTAPN